MTSALRFDGRVAIITGAGNGLGRSHALLLASRGAKVVVNDLGGSHTGGGQSSSAADRVVEEIRAAGGTAVANYDSVEEGGKIVQAALGAFGRIDVVVNNAGILRDVSFPKMTDADWDLVYRVHVLGAYRVTAAAWPHLREQKYGRVIFTSSAAGIYGNFGQANYAMAKLALVGFASTLAIEGRKSNVLVNTIAPIAGSRMTETVLPKNLLDALEPRYVSALVAWLCHESQQDTGGLFEVGGGLYTKLRWERTSGRTFRIGRAVSPEDVRDSWGDIGDFASSTHPASVAESMAPIMANVEAGPSKGANQFIDVDRALGWEMPEQTTSYDARDAALYALGIGAAKNPLDSKELAYVYELNGAGFQPFPTFAVAPVIGLIMKLASEGKQAPGLNFGLDRILHGEQFTEVMRPLPPRQTLKHRGKIKAIYDKGKGAVIVNEVLTYDEDGDLLARNEVTTFVRGAGGFGGDRGPAGEADAPPDRAPDAIVEEKTSEDQALLYRLSGDINPLHADPGFATAFGFSRPILHGLCTYGFAARHVVKAMAGNDARLFKSIRARFAEPVFPGETIVTEMWRLTPERVVFRCKVKERDKLVITNAHVALYTQVPTKAPKAKPEATAAAAAPAADASNESQPTSADIFAGITRYVEKNPDAAAKIGVVYQFRLTAPDAVWTLDLKSTPPRIASGDVAKAECTLALTDADFLAMSTGRADPMKLFTSGKLTISGNIMASQKLEFLKKVDPLDVAAAMRARTGAPQTSGPSSPTLNAAPSAPPAAPHSAFAPGFFDALASHPELTRELGADVTFVITSPDATYAIVGGRAQAGRAQAPAAVFTLADTDLASLARGDQEPRALFQRGTLRVEGDLRIAHRLSLFSKLGFTGART